jgi:hypothetical protein
MVRLENFCGKVHQQPENATLQTWPLQRRVQPCQAFFRNRSSQWITGASGVTDANMQTLEGEFLGLLVFLERQRLVLAQHRVCEQHVTNPFGWQFAQFVNRGVELFDRGLRVSGDGVFSGRFDVQGDVVKHGTHSDGIGVH